ncbi:probable inactive ATP-dependent zinc metalloprotease FTSHI 3, chloroplastic [Tanacetum coccineum]
MSHHRLPTTPFDVADLFVVIVYGVWYWWSVSDVGEFRMCGHKLDVRYRNFRRIADTLIVMTIGGVVYTMMVSQLQENCRHIDSDDYWWCCLYYDGNKRSKGCKKQVNLRSDHLYFDPLATDKHLLALTDEFNKDDNVVVIAFTNRLETLDPALLRPCRFTKKVVVNAPDQEGRRKILRKKKNTYATMSLQIPRGLLGLGVFTSDEFMTFDDILQALAKTKSSAQTNGIGPSAVQG